jgi:hypothetical protein
MQTMEHKKAVTAFIRDLGKKVLLRRDEKVHTYLFTLAV